MNKPLVSVIVINMNGIGFLKILLPSLAKEKYANKEIILVDNGSHDGSVEFVAKRYPKIKLIVNKDNKGFTGANNQGYEIAKGKYVFLLNNDTKVPTNLFAPMVDLMESNPKIGACQPRVVRQDDVKRIDSVGSYFTRTGFLFHYGYGFLDSKKLQRRAPLFSAKGCALFLRKSLIDRIGMLDPDYFAYFEETDLCWRIWLSGYEIYYVYETYILHKGWGTVGKMNFSFFNYHSYKNRIMSLIKNLQTSNLILILPVNVALSIMASLAYLFTGRFQESFSVWKAFAWLIRNRKLVAMKRRQIQSLRAKKDSEFLPRLTQKVTLPYFYYLFTGLEKYKTVSKDSPFFR